MLTRSGGDDLASVMIFMTSESVTHSVVSVNMKRGLLMGGANAAIVIESLNNHGQWKIPDNLLWYIA